MDDASEISTPPPLRQTLRRWSIGIGTLVVILAIAWGVWNKIANVRLQAKIDSIVARHEPVYPDDFLDPALPDDQNAATYYNAAIAAKKPNVDSPAASNMIYTNYPPFPPAWYQLADAAVAANPRTLALAHQARAFQRSQWIKRFSSPIYLTLLPFLNSQRDLANLIGDAALDAHLHGDDALAIERVRDELHQSDAINDFTLIERLVSIGIQAMAIDRLEVISADNIQIQNALFHTTPTTTSTITPVPRQAILDLIGELLDETKAKAARKRAIWGERMCALDNANVLIEHATVTKPMLKLDAIRCLDKFDRDSRAIDQANWPAAQAVFGAAPSQPPNRFRGGTSTTAPFAPIRFSRAFSLAFLPSFDRYALTEWRVCAERRTAAVTIAARLFHSDHDHWPTSLNELVPGYLPEIPKDPFSASGAAIGYLLQSNAASGGADRPLVFFDPPGSPTGGTPPMLPNFGWQNTSMRQWRDLTLWVPFAPAATTTPATQE